MRVAQVTDPHVTLAGRAPAGYDPAAALGAVLARVAALDPRPEAVVLTGDLAESGDAGEYRRLVAVSAGFGLPMAAIPGNHDVRAAFADGLRGSGIVTGSGGFLHFALDAGPLRLLCLDTLAPGGVSGGLLCGARLDWVAARLAEDERPAMIFMHHPPFRIGQAPADDSFCQGGDRLGAILSRNRPRVLGVACGHVHRAVLRAWAGTVGMVCPPVAWEVPLDHPAGAPLRLERQDPAFMVHDWSPALGLVSHVVRLPASP